MCAERLILFSTPVVAGNLLPSERLILQVPLVDGRYFTIDDEDQPSIIVDELLAKELWPGRSAVGQQLFIVHTFRGPEPREIVGVVRYVQPSTSSVRRPVTATPRRC